MDEYVPESSMINIEEIRNSVHFSIKKFPDAVYFGECIKNGKAKLIRQGKGIMKYINNRVYEGEWDDD